MKAQSQATPMAESVAAIEQMQSLFDIAYDGMQTATAIIDAARVLCALERSPEHHDTHPSHNIKTGGGFAHGIRAKDHTLPAILCHAHHMIEVAMNDVDVMRENAIDALKGGAQ